MTGDKYLYNSSEYNDKKALTILYSSRKPRVFVILSSKKDYDKFNIKQPTLVELADLVALFDIKENSQILTFLNSKNKQWSQKTDTKIGAFYNPISNVLIEIYPDSSKIKCFFTNSYKESIDEKIINFYNDSLMRIKDDDYLMHIRYSYRPNYAPSGFDAFSKTICFSIKKMAKGYGGSTKKKYK